MVAFVLNIKLIILTSGVVGVICQTACLCLLFRELYNTSLFMQFDLILLIQTHMAHLTFSMQP